MKEVMMKKQEWLIAGLVAVTVAVMTGAFIAPPMLWADDAVQVKIPALPSAGLDIPALKAKVTATTTSTPGQPVQVALKVTAPAGNDTIQVPVTVIVEKTSMYPMSRSLPMPTILIQASTTVTVDSGGTGSAVVSLPLTWADAAPTSQANTGAQTPALNGMVTTYNMVLTSGDGTISSQMQELSEMK
jgi:hypothetical protein